MGFLEAFLKHLFRFSISGFRSSLPHTLPNSHHSVKSPRLSMNSSCGHSPGIGCISEHYCQVKVDSAVIQWGSRSMVISQMWTDTGSLYHLLFCLDALVRFYNTISISASLMFTLWKGDVNFSFKFKHVSMVLMAAQLLRCELFQRENIAFQLLQHASASVCTFLICSFYCVLFEMLFYICLLYILCYIWKIFPGNRDDAISMQLICFILDICCSCKSRSLLELSIF